MFGLTKFTINKFTTKTLLISLIRYKRHNLNIDIFKPYTLDLLARKIHKLSSTTTDLSHNVSKTVSTINSLELDLLYKTLELEIQKQANQQEISIEDLSHQLILTSDIINTVDIDNVYNTLNLSIEEVRHSLQIIVEDLSHKII